ncbi:MAG: P-loop NTPase fold protein, partial [Nitrospinae bacterium]|nr:P-loop NTPase fold protein [Nitrospinota bacterium]
MRFQIQPPEIKVLEDDPFKNDLLGRRETVEVLTNIVGSIEGPCVLSVDAAWGAGKTTFLKMWAQHLRNEGFPVVEFNAWETDFSEEPFIALSTELTEGLQKYADESLKQKIDVMKGKAKEVARALIPGIIKAAAAGVPLVGGELGEALASLVEEKLNTYEKARKSIKTFRSSLQDMANTLSKSKGTRPLVVVIDELDRCRPSYAVALLEVAKHIFAVDHVVFVLGVNRSELAHSVKALYGNDFDALGYLGRFFDLDFRLPKPGRGSFIDALMKETGIND